MFVLRLLIIKVRDYFWKKYKKFIKDRKSVKYFSFLALDLFTHKFDFEIFIMTVKDCLLPYVTKHMSKTIPERSIIIFFLKNFYPYKVYLLNFLTIYWIRVFYVFRNFLFFKFKRDKPFWKDKHYPYNIFFILSVAFFFYKL